MVYKEFRVFKKLFAITGFGIKLITDKGSYGIRFYKDSIRISKGISEKFYYFR